MQMKIKAENWCFAFINTTKFAYFYWFKILNVHLSIFLFIYNSIEAMLSSCLLYININVWHIHLVFDIHLYVVVCARNVNVNIFRIGWVGLSYQIVEQLNWFYVYSKPCNFRGIEELFFFFVAFSYYGLIVKTS